MYPDDNSLETPPQNPGLTQRPFDVVQPPVAPLQTPQVQPVTPTVVPPVAPAVVSPPPSAVRPVVSGRPDNGPYFKVDKKSWLATLVVIGIVCLLALAGLAAYKVLNPAKPTDETGYAANSLSTKGLDELKNFAKDKAQLGVNGRLQVNQTLVLTPSSTPTNPTAGQIYYDKTTQQPYYYNGTTFVSLSPQAFPETILSTVANHTTLIADLSGPRVTSLQGQTGNVTLTAGQGISISGTTITATLTLPQDLSVRPVLASQVWPLLAALLPVLAVVFPASPPATITNL